MSNTNEQKSLDARQKYILSFNDTMIKIWKEQITLLNVIDTRRQPMPPSAVFMQILYTSQHVHNIKNPASFRLWMKDERLTRDRDLSHPADCEAQRRYLQGPSQTPVFFMAVICAFALTARMDNATLHPGCRCALPWAMCFCAYSACWSMYFLRTSSQSKSGTVPFWVQQTGHPTKWNTVISTEGSEYT